MSNMFLNEIPTGQKGVVFVLNGGTCRTVQKILSRFLVKKMGDGYSDLLKCANMLFFGWLFCLNDPSVNGLF